MVIKFVPKLILLGFLNSDFINIGYSRFIIEANNIYDKISFNTFVFFSKFGILILNKDCKLNISTVWGKEATKIKLDIKEHFNG